MWNRIFPQPADNEYRGHKLALWFFYLITTITIVRSCIHMFKHDGGAQSIATIPLDTFTESGAGAVIFIFAYWGLSQLMFGIFYLIVLLKYKSLIPLMYLTLILEYGGRLGLSFYKTIETTEQAPGAVANMVLPVVCMVMFFLSVNVPNQVQDQVSSSNTKNGE